MSDQHRSKSSRPVGSSKPSTAYRTASGRPTGSRPSQNGTRRPASAGARRPAPTGARRPVQAKRRPPQRRRKQGLPILPILIVLLVIIAVIMFFVLKPKGGSDSNKPSVAAPSVGSMNGDTVDVTESTESDQSRTEALAAMLENEDEQVVSLDASEMVDVADLSINQDLPSDWMNVLFLGSDERTLNASARSDSMIICSINTKTGEVKLTSIMRDIAVKFDNLGKNNGTYRINAASFFGGEKLAVKTINECFGMNIQYYVHVNFYGFQQIAQMLGGIEIDITEEEFKEINKRIVEQAKFMYYAGLDDSATIPYEYLENYGSNVHLDGRQTLAYARIRKLAGGDYARAERQRTVLSKLLGKVKGLGIGEILALGTSGMQFVRTNMELNDILTIAQTVIANTDNFSTLESFRLPINDSYVQEKRNEKSMLYDCDWSANSLALYNFIYE